MKTILGSIQKIVPSIWPLNSIFINLIICLVHLGAGSLYSQAPEWEWVNGLNAGSGNAIVLDGAGNNYSIGTFIGQADFDQGAGQFFLYEGGTFILKQNGSGNFEWVQQLGGYDNCFGNSIAIDNSGNIYTTGSFNGSVDFDPGSDVFELTSVGENDIFICKLDDQGNFEWAKSLGGTSADEGASLSTDAAGNVYSTGYFSGTADFDPGSGTFNLVSQGVKDIYISKLNSNGNFSWAKAIGGSTIDIAKSIDLDDSGNVHISGNFGGTVDFNPGSGTFNLTSAGNNDFFICKLDATGNFSWAKAVGGINEDISNCLTLDASGNIYTTGSFEGTVDFDPGTGTSNISANGFFDQFVLKLTSAGNFEWAKSIGGDNSGVAGLSITIDGAGNIYTTGGFLGLADFDPGPETNFLYSNGSANDIAVLKLNNSGDFEWALSAQGENEDFGNSIAVDASENPFVAGRYSSVWIDFGDISFDDAFGGGDKLFVAKINSIGVPPLYVTITNSTNVICHGEQNGSATATATGGVSPYSFEWSNGATSSSISNLGAGTYYVTVTDGQGTTAHTAVSISQPAVLSFNPPTITTISCSNGNDGSIQAFATGGVPPYSFEWSNGSSTSFISNLFEGPYTVTVTDNHDCIKIATYEVTQPPLLEISLEYLQAETCMGVGDGAISILLAGGVDPYIAEWSNGYTGTINADLMPGEYFVTVTDENLCTTAVSYVINEGAMVLLNLTQISHVTCEGGSNGNISISAYGGMLPYQYAWSNGATESTITGLSSSTYQVTASDDNGCIITESFEVTQPLAIAIQIMQVSPNYCAGDSTADLNGIVSGGIAPYAAAWSNGVTGLENLNLLADIYSITVTDANTCTSILFDTITDPLSLQNNVSTTNETSSGANDGTAMSNPTGGVPPFSFLWNNGDTLSTLSGLSPGTYTVTSTDANGCTAEGTALVNAFGCTLDILPIADFTICEDDTVVIQPIVMGGNGLSYLWSDGSTGESLSVHQGAEYCVTITDAANCQDLDCVMITEIIIPPLTCPATDESAPGANDGAIQCDSLSGIISYLWSNDSTTSSIEGLAPGQYCVTVTEQNGCTKTQCFYVQPGDCQLAVNSVTTNVLCSGEATGSVALTADNGTVPITYAWSNGQSDSLIENLIAGNYAVTVADASGCVSLQSFIISEPPPISVAIDSIASADATGSGLIWITAAGGTPDYSYQWVGPLGEIILSEDLNNLTQSGNYSLVLTDAAGCVTILDSVYVDQHVAVDHTSVLKSIKVYPVPAKDVLMVNTVYAIEEAFITGVDGRVYKHIIKPGSNKFDVADLGPGWYVLRMFDGRDWYVARMVK